MQEIKFYSRPSVPVELHKVRIVQKLNLKPIDERLKAIQEGGFNTFLLNTKDIFLDMLTDSGTNAMSDNQISSMLQADDAYSGSQSFYRMEEALREVFGKHYVLPVHQGRAAENIISQVFVNEGDVIPMNYHFTTTKAHMEINGGTILEIYTDEALKIKSTNPFKGNMDLNKLKAFIEQTGTDRIPFGMITVTNNSGGGQPVSMENIKKRYGEYPEIQFDFNSNRLDREGYELLSLIHIELIAVFNHPVHHRPGHLWEPRETVNSAAVKAGDVVVAVGDQICSFGEFGH